MSQSKRREAVTKIGKYFTLRWAAACGVGAALVMAGGIVLHRPVVRAADGGATANGGPSAQIAEFWNDWQSNKPSVAIRRVAPTPEVAHNWENAQRQADDFQNRWGQCAGYSLIVRKPLGDDLEYDAFLAKYETFPLRVQTLWYNGRGHWKMVALRIDSDPTRWMEEITPTPTSITVEQNLAPTDQVNPEPQPAQ